MSIFPMISPPEEGSAQTQSLPLYREVAWDFENDVPIFRGGQPVDQVVVDACKDYIESQRPVGAAVTVASAQPVEVDVSAQVIREAGASLAEVERAFAAKLDAYLAQLAFEEFVVYLHQVGALLKAVAETLLGFPVTVIEYFSDYWVELNVGSDGKLPPGVFQLKERLRDIMPAHLGWGLVIPTKVYVPARIVPVPRLSRSAPPRYRAQLAARRVPAALGLGMRYSTITLPMAADRLLDGCWASPNGLPMAAYEEVKSDGI